MRAAATNTPLVLARTELGAGHGGPSGRTAQTKETAVKYAFALRMTCAVPGGATVPVRRPCYTCIGVMVVMAGGIVAFMGYALAVGPLAKGSTVRTRIRETALRVFRGPAYDDFGEPAYGKVVNRDEHDF